MPFVAVAEGPRRQVRWLFLVAAVLTTAVFPVFWNALASLDGVAIVLLNGRNLILLALLVTLISEGE